MITPYVTLIAPPGLKSLKDLQMHSPNPPLGMAYIAATLKAENINYFTVDATGEGLDQIAPHPSRPDLYYQGLNAAEIVERIPPETNIVGISCMFSTLWPASRDIANAVRKKFPDALFVLGGEHGTAVPENVLKTSDIDVVVLGEGEETFLKVIEAYSVKQDLSSVQGISMIVNNNVVHNGLSRRIIAIDDIPTPDWDSIPIEGYISRHQINGVNLGRSMPLLATRGCPYKCSFCSNPGMWTQRYVTRNPIMVVDEIEYLKDKYNVVNFDFQDLTAIVKRAWVIDFSNELIKRNLNITWQMPSGTRSEVFDEEVADLLYRSGCRVLAFAPESGDKDVLAAVYKQVDLDSVIESARIAIRRGINVSLFFVIGFPEDTATSLKHTLKYIRKIAILGVHDISVTKFVPYPGSKLFHELQDSGAIELDDQFFVSAIDFYAKSAPSYSKNVSTQTLFRSMIWMYLNFYIISFLIRPIRVFTVLYNAIVKGREETRYAKWFVDRFVTRRKWQKLKKSN